jgi:preprotein translocase subunit SecG
MLFVIVAVLTLLAALLVLMILAQDSKSGALTSSFGASQVMGVKRTADLLEKLTWSFMAAIMVITLSAKFFIGTGEDSEGPSSINVESAKIQAGFRSSAADTAAGWSGRCYRCRLGHQALILSLFFGYRT